MAVLSSRTVVITGCSSGFGRATALRLAREQWRVFAAVRRDEDAAHLVAEAGSLAGGALVPVVCDITEADDVARLATIAGETTSLDALVNNAGTAFPAPIERLPVDELRAQFEVNVFGHVAVTQALLPLLKRSRGTIVNVSSVGGRISTPMLGAYNASKFALEALSDVLRIELAPFGVRVVVIEPSASPTAIWRTGLSRTDQRDAGDYAPLSEAVRRLAGQSASSGFPPELFAATVSAILKTPRPRALKW
jgi:NAD(P)-dependent dehydrogenase (short-subunit alcohol dehydrogenase family)